MERKLCEKIMSLMCFSFTEDPITDLNNKIRHIYDIYKLLENQEINDFFNSPQFDELLLIVANDDVISFKSNNGWLDNHPATAMIYADIENTWGRCAIPITPLLRNWCTANCLQMKKCSVL